MVVEQTRGPAETSQRLARKLSDLIHHADRRREMGDAMRGLARPEAARDVALRIEQVSCKSGQVLSLPNPDPGRFEDPPQSRVG